MEWGLLEQTHMGAPACLVQEGPEGPHPIAWSHTPPSEDRPWNLARSCTGYCPLRASEAGAGSHQQLGLGQGAGDGPAPQGSLAWHGYSVRPGEVQMWILVKARSMFLETGPILPIAVVGVPGHTPLFPETGRETNGACAFPCFWSLASSSRPGLGVPARTAVRCSRYTLGPEYLLSPGP